MSKPFARLLRKKPLDFILCPRNRNLEGELWGRKVATADAVYPKALGMGRKPVSHDDWLDVKARGLTSAAHMPAAHRAHMEWTPQRLIHRWGEVSARPQPRR
jgi:hypothetical protein